ncbi:MAG: DNA repair protein RecN [Cellvibrionaceae bacterium]|nr:DNA repair protein RecN [Cellvibrionaceae bacterium]
MLRHITINNFMLIEHLDLSIASGMTAITGESGTGKSVLLSALAMALGERADGERVRHHCEKADITATFSLDDVKQAQHWLVEQDLNRDDECLLRRVITREGRSRGFVNGQPVTLQQLRTLGELLIDVHSQHAHQALLHKTSHCRLLDSFAKHTSLVTQVKNAYQHWQTLRNRYRHLRDHADEHQSRRQLLEYQVEEFKQLDLQDNEIDVLETRQTRLANAESLIEKGRQLDALCEEGDHSIRQQLQQALAIAESMHPQTDTLNTAIELFSSAIIHLDEAQNSIHQQVNTAEIDPEQLDTIETRLSAIYTLARKHHIHPDRLIEQHKALTEELQQLHTGGETLTELEQQGDAAYEQFAQLATQLSQQRHSAAEKLSRAINRQLQQLDMNNANFTVYLGQTPDKPSSQGIDDIEFLISTNPGLTHKPLGKVVSGGELSRISLAIQAATAQTSRVATLIFDEVDVGIGGRTADTVGKLLAQLGQHSQVICITHLAQVASKAAQHWQVSKTGKKQSTASAITTLTGEDKVTEIARMISGKNLSEQSMAYAREMLEEAQ